MIDRTKQPIIKTAGKPEMTSPETIKLKNGIPVYLLKSGTMEVSRIDFIFDAGLWFESAPLQAALANAMLQEGNKQYSGAQLAEIFDFHGAYIQFQVDQHYATISLVSVNKHLAHLLPVVEELIKNSVFEEKELKTLVSRRRQRFLLENEKVKVLCQKKFSEALFGDGHPYAQTLKIEDFDSVNRESLVDFYSKHYHSGNCQILAAGKLEDNLLELLGNHFGGNDWEVENPASVRDFYVQPSPEKKLQLEKKGAIQSAIRIGGLTINKHHPDYHGVQVLNTVLGGYFSSRLMNNIREEKGYTYGIGSSVISFPEAAYLVIATETDNSYVQDTIKEVFFELKRLREELVPEDELERVRQYLLGEFIRDFDGPFAQAQSFRSVADYGLDHCFHEAYYETLKTIDAHKLQQLAQQYLNENDFYTVVTGAEIIPKSVG
jgi:predicted Zn-dependent peptidase